MYNAEARPCVQLHPGIWGSESDNLKRDMSVRVHSCGRRMSVYDDSI